MKTYFLIFLICWAFLSFFSVVYNVKKMTSEVQQWSALSDDAKRQKLFGSSYELASFVSKNTNYNEEILFFSSDGMTFYYNRYFLYPRRLTWVQTKQELLTYAGTKKFTTIVLANATFSLHGYEEIASLSYKGSDKQGRLYRKQ